MTRTHLLNGLLLAAAALALAACGGHKSTPVAVVTPPPPPPAPTLQAGFGAGFAAAYNAMANTEPSKPDPAGIVAVSLTTEPTPLHS